MLQHQMDLRHIYEYIKACRPQIAVNDGFKLQMAKLEITQFGATSVASDLCGADWKVGGPCLMLIWPRSHGIPHPRSSLSFHISLLSPRFYVNRLSNHPSLIFPPHPHPHPHSSPQSSVLCLAKHQARVYSDGRA